MMAVVFLAVWPGGTARSQTLSPYSEFQNLKASELGTLQGKLTPVGSRVGHEYSAAFNATGHAIDLSVFRPFYRSQFMGGYSLDTIHPQTFSATAPELAALIDSIGALPGVTDGGVDTGGGLSLSFSVVKGGTAKVFESIIDTTNSRLVFGRMLGALATNSAGKAVITDFACSLGLLPGPKQAEVTAQVSVVVRGFRKDRATGQYAAKVRITNNGSAIQAPVILAFRPDENITLVGGSGLTCALSPPGAPYVGLPVKGTLGSGLHVDVVLHFDNPDGSPIVLNFPHVYAGPGFR